MATYADAREDQRETAEELLWKSDISGKVLRGGTMTVERDPLQDWLLLLLMERIVWMEPVGEQFTEAESGTVIDGLTESLFKSTTG